MRVSIVLLLVAVAVSCCVSFVSASEAEVEVVGALPDLRGASLNAVCRQNGFSGKCGPVRSCKGGIVRGLCYGGTDISCCMTATDAKNAGLPKVRPSTVPRTAYRSPQSAQQRAAEAEMKAKWLRFKMRNNRRYATVAAENLANAAWRKNRLNIIAMNDKYRTTMHKTPPFMSTGPFVDMDAATFKQHFLTTRLTAEGKVQANVRRSLVQMSSEADVDVEAELDIEAEFESKLDAEAEVDADAEADDDDEEEADSDADAEAEYEDSLSSSFLEQAARAETGVGESCKNPTTGKSGQCKYKGECPLSTYTQVSGQCPGASTICCIGGSIPSGPVSPAQNSAYTPVIRPVVGEMIVDWREKQSPIRNQGFCGSCWAHAAVAAVETAVAIKNGGVPPVLSVQQVMDCTNPGRDGCQGTSYQSAFQYMMKSSVQTAAAIPYRMGQGTCTAPDGTIVPGQPLMKEWQFGTENLDETKLLENLKQFGPQVIVVDGDKWQPYEGGLYPKEACKNDFGDVNHAVVIVGYGQENGVNFWLVRNSWGATWGESGYIRLEAGINSCGLALYPQYPVMV